MHQTDVVVIVIALLASFSTWTLAQPACCTSGSGCPTQGTCCGVATGLQNCTYLNGVTVSTTVWPPVNIESNFRLTVPGSGATWASLGQACLTYAEQFLCNSSAFASDNFLNVSCASAPPPPGTAACEMLFSICGISTVYVPFLGIATKGLFCGSDASGMQQPLGAFALAALMLAAYVASRQSQ